MVYGCDAPWWRHRNGLPEFSGLKVTFRGNGLKDYPDILRVEIAKDGRGFSPKLCFETGTIGGGGNSGFQAVNLAASWGARKIILIGFDMTDRGGVHWYGRNRWQMATNPMESNFQRWREWFAAAAPELAARGVEVMNASPDSALTCFPKADLKDCL